MLRHGSSRGLTPAAIDHHRIRHEVQIRLSTLSHLALALCVERVLKQLGYRNFRILGHWYLPGRSFITRSDLSARGMRFADPLQIIIRIKRYTVQVERTAVNDLYKEMLRSGAPEALLVTTSDFSDAAGQATLCLPGRAVKLLEGEQLADLLIQYGFGVRQCRDIVTGEEMTVLDDLAFANLERIAEALKDVNE